jgi:hypothetical protein
MINTVLLFTLLVSVLIISKMMMGRLAVIHALTNSGMGAALNATVVALRSDAKAKRELANHIGGREQLAAADAADMALKQGEELLLAHNKGQKQADMEPSMWAFWKK